VHCASIFSCAKGCFGQLGVDQWSDVTRQRVLIQACLEMPLTAPQRKLTRELIVFTGFIIL
jgi:dihydroneopterin aldolase